MQGANKTSPNACCARNDPGQTAQGWQGVLGYFTRYCKHTGLLLTQTRVKEAKKKKKEEPHLKYDFIACPAPNDS